MIYSSAPISMPNMKALAQILIEISCTQDFQILFSKGHNSEKGHNSDMKKIQVKYFFMRNVHMKFRNPSIHRSKVNTGTDTQAKFGKSNMPFQLFQRWGHKNSSYGHFPLFPVNGNNIAKSEQSSKTPA